MEIGKYYIGLDVGTNSVGRAVTDQDFNLLRLKGKTAWGSRLFSDAKSAQERRQYRSNRRRMARRKFRVFLLNKLFSNELNKIDNGFLGRLELSALYNEHNNVSLLFNDKNKEKDFYNKYPTIYHLRYAMVNNEADAFSDLRYVYLALHHIIKYRGNFLTEGEINFNSIDDDLIERFNNVLLAFLEKENIESESLIDKEIVNKIIDILKSDEFKRAKQTLIKKTLNNNPTIKEFLSNQIDVFASLVSGGSLNFSKFGTEEKGTISLAKDYDEKIVILENCLDNDYLELIDICKNIYDHVYLENLLKDSKYLSESFVKLYEEHKEDKDALKSFLKQIDKKNGNNHYKSLVFNESGNENNYYKYITGTDSKCSLEEFDKFLIKNIFENQGFLDAFGQNPQFNELYKKAQNETLLKTISNTIGSEIPHQLHEIELMKILENSKKHFSFIEDIEDKIISIFKFKVEYYVGPSNTKSSYSNVVKFEGKEEEKVFPWNRKEIINIDASREKFMKVRLNSCTYLWGEEVLPKNSILLNDVFNLNVINTLKINGKNVDNKLKLEIFRFVNEKPKTTIKQLKTYLKCRYPEIYGTDDVAISGVNDTFSFVSPIRPAVGKYFNLDKTEVLDKLEEIIRILTIFGDSNNDAIKFIKENNAKFQLTDLQFACLKKLKCKDRGTLSRKLLLGLRSIDENGVALSIYDVLLQTNLNLQQAIFDKNYNFIDRINLTNDEFLKNNKNAIKEQIDETPAVIRRPIIQARRIVKEVTKIIGHSPEKICIEFTRTNKAEKKETTSRKKELEDFYKSLEKDIKKARSLDISNEQVDELKSELENISEEQILGEHLYLYFKQLGYDMYTGEKIDIKGIFDGTFDIDHIFPVSKGGENILDNKVLVNKKDNQRVKRDVYPLPDSIYFNEKVRKLWLFLRKKNLISDKKYNYLISRDEVKEEDILGFTVDQLTKTNYSNKTLGEILKGDYPDAKVIYSKAEEAHYLRKELSIPKIRELNDTHHAVDAYLNVVSGSILYDTYQARFWKIKDLVDKDNNKVGYNKDKVLLSILKRQNLVEKIINNCFRHDMLMTYREEYLVPEFYKKTINKASDSSALYPIHTKDNSPYNNTSVYGGYTSLSRSYLAVAYTKKKKLIVDIPTLYIGKVLNGKYKNLKYLSKDEQLELTKYIKLANSIKDELKVDYSNIIPVGSKVECNGVKYLIRTNSDDRISLKLFMKMFLTKHTLNELYNLQRYATKFFKRISNENNNEIKIFTDKNHTNFMEVSKLKNLDIMREILQICNQPRYKDFGFIKKNIINDFDADKFLKLTIRDQYTYIINALTSLNKDLCSWRFTKGTFFADKNWYVFKESITGLYSKKFKI